VIHPLMAGRVGIGILSFGVVVSDFELLSQRRHFKKGGLLYWKLKPKAKLSLRNMVLTIGKPLLEYPGILSLISIRCLAAIFLLIASVVNKPAFFALLLAIVTIATFGLNSRPSTGKSGAEQMMLISLICWSSVFILHDDRAQMVPLFFLSAQLTMAYATSSLIKFGRDVRWHNGQFITEIAATSTYGRETLYVFLRDHPRIAKGGSSSLLIIELIISMAPWVPPPVCLFLLTCALMFHLMNAIIMGLNTFVYSFASTFPAALCVSLIIYSGRR